MTLTVGSLFAGIGGFDLGLERAGMRVAWAVERDRQALSVLARHWPDVAGLEDVRDVTARSVPPVDLICGGFPCQDISVAGSRAGLAGARSGLWWEFARIVGELRPAWVLVENVPGLLSSNEGRDMGTVLGDLADLGYGWAYRVLDAQFFGVAQRRRRVFVVGRAGDRAGRLPAEVLFDAASLQRHPPARREAGTGVAVGSVGATGDGGRGWRVGADEAAAGHVVAALTSRYAKGPDSDTTDGIALAQCHGSNVGPMGALRSGNGGVTGGVPFAFALRGRDGGAQPELTGDQASALRGAEGGSSRDYIAFNWQSGGDCRINHSPQPDALSASQTQAVAFKLNQRREGRVSAVSGAVHEPSGTQVQGVLPGPRRLTPRECERLQGFPDDWTRYTHDGTELADSPRYRMLGNAVAVPVAEWVGRRILEVGA